jgi:hypothetical protein
MHEQQNVVQSKKYWTTITVQKVSWKQFILYKAKNLKTNPTEMKMLPALCRSSRTLSNAKKLHQVESKISQAQAEHNSLASYLCFT